MSAAQAGACDAAGRRHAGYLPAVAASLQKAEETGKPAGAMVLPDGRVVTGKTSSLLGASASLLLNALKAQGGVSDKLDLISAQVIEPISKLKIESLGHHNPRLHSDEVLIALCISALTNPIAQLAQEQLGSLRGCDAHFSVIISEEDVKLYKRLGIHVTCEPRYEVKKLYHSNAAKRGSISTLFVTPKPNRQGANIHDHH